MSNFLDDHPGGKNVILRWAGKDATETYDPIHPPDTLDKFLDKSKHLGEVNMDSVEQEQEFDPDEEERQERIKHMPILEQCYNLMDFEAVAKRVMKKTAWAYYSSGADDEIVSIPLLLPALLMSGQRLCGKTILRITKSGFGQGYYTTLKTLISRQQCWELKLTSHSMSQPLLSES